MFIDPVEFTVKVSGDLAVREVPGATVTPFGKGRLRVAWGQPSHFTTGAVYDQGGSLVPESQRIGGLHYDHALAADPGKLPPPSGKVRDVPGTWLFGGTWFNHFGHFLTETVTTLWPEKDVDGLVFVPFWFGRDVVDWQRELLALAGHPGTVQVVGPEQVRVERLLVPDRPVIPNGNVRAEAVEVWRRMSRAARRDAAPELVFMSRSHHHRAVQPGSRAARRVADNEVELDDLMRSLGYTVVHPEGLTATEQISTVTGARVLVGVAGSALHLSVFAPEGATVVELGDPRRRTVPVHTQMMLCKAGKNPLAFIPFPSQGNGYDLTRIAGLLTTHGLTLTR